MTKLNIPHLTLHIIISLMDDQLIIGKAESCFSFPLLLRSYQMYSGLRMVDFGTILQKTPTTMGGLI